MRDRRFHLQKQASNDKDPEDKINKLKVINKRNPVTENDLSFVQMDIRNTFSQNEPKYCKLVGITQNKNNDKFVFEFSHIIEIANEIDPTKRNILKLIGMFFDSGLNFTNRFTKEIVI